MKKEALFFTDKTEIGAQHVPIDTTKFAEGGLIAPNGKPSNLTPEQYKLVRTPEFKAWFGDWENDPKNASKVVDSNGEPLVVYHGTTENFTAFNTKSYFTDDYMNADGYANGEIVIEAFLIIKNPLIINAKGRKWNDLKSKYGGSTREIVGSLDHEKYDGVIFNSINDNWFDDEGEPQNVYNVNEPNQIKLADGTNTTFDGKNPDIRFKDGGSIDNEKIVCHNCGWSWKVEDGGDDLYECHKCGCDNTDDYSNQFAVGGLIAPNGKPSNLTPEQYKLVRTPEFKAWFGDWENDPKNASKVIDKNGEPLVVYHFTDKKFNLFELKGLSNGFFFTEYKKDEEFSYTKNPKPYFLSIKRMAEVSEVPNKYWSTPNYENEFIDKSKKDGGNGIQFIREIDNKRIIVAFEPNQIKLANGTNTTFDPNNPDIRYAGGGNIDINEPFNVNGKTLAERVRILVKQLYPDYKWSVTSSYNKLDVYLLEADFDPFTAKWKEEHPDRELYYNVDDRDFEPYNRENNAKITDRAVEVFKPIRDYINKFVYNRNENDPYADYVDYNVYEYTYIGKWDKPYKQVEPKAGKKKTKAPVTPTKLIKELPYKIGDILALSQDVLNTYSGAVAEELSQNYYEVGELINIFSRYLIKFNSQNERETTKADPNKIIETHVIATKPLFKTGDTVVNKLRPDNPYKIKHRAYYQQIGVKYASLEKRFLLSGMSWHYELDNGSYAFENELELYNATPSTAPTSTPNNVFSIQNIVSKTQWSEGLKKTMIEDFVNSSYENVTPLIGSDVRETSKNIENKVDGFSSGKNTYLQANMLAEEIHKLIDAGNSPSFPTTPTVENTFIDYLTANTEKANEISKELEVTSSLAMFLMGLKDIADLDSKKYAELMEEFFIKFPKLIEDDSTNAN